MKKLMILSIAIAAIGLATPQISRAAFTNAKIVSTQDKQVKYHEIKSEELPAAVTTALSKDYSGFKVNHAFKGDDGSFKVLVSNESTHYALYYGADGNLIKAEQPDKKTEMPPKK